MGRLEGIPTVADVARAFGVHPATLYRWASEPFRPGDAPKIVILGGHVWFQDQFGADMYDAKTNPAALAERQSQADEQRAGELRKELIRDDWIDPKTGKTRTAHERDVVRDERAKAGRAAERDKELAGQRAQTEANGGDPRRTPIHRGTAPNKALAEAKAHGVRVARPEPAPEPVGVGVA